MRSVTPLTLCLGLFALLSVPGCSTDSKEPESKEAPPTTTTGEQPKPPNLPSEKDEPKAPVTPVVPGACPGQAGELYAINAKKLAQTDETQLCTLRSRVLLIVNGASYCGETYQYEPLQALYDKYKDQKLDVLAFPSKSFNQEKDSDQDVSTFCTTQYHITFPLFTIGPVVDKAATATTPAETAQPVYQWLKMQPGMADPIPWNFEKFIIGKDGKVARRFYSSVNPTMTFATPAAQGGDKITEAHKAKGVVNVVEDAILTELEKP